MKELLLKYALLNSFEKNEVQTFIDFLLAKRKKSLNTPRLKKNLPKVSVWETDDFYKTLRQNDKPMLSW